MTLTAPPPTGPGADPRPRAGATDAGTDTGPGAAGADTRPGAAPPRGWGDPADPTGLAAALAGQVPGAELVATLEGLEVGTVTDAVVIEAIAAWERVKAHAEAELAHLYVRLVDRVAADPLLPASQALRHAGAEVACRLAISDTAAGRRLGTAVTLDSLPELADALAAGRIDATKVQVLLAETEHLPRQRRRTAIVALLPDAGALAPAQLRHRIRKTLTEADPDTAALRHAKAVKDRAVWRESAPDGMAYLHLFDTATNIEAAHTALAAQAGPPSRKDPRTAAARRADALVALLTGRTSPDTRCTVALEVTVGAGTLLGLDDRPGHLAGYGPIPADLARQVATDATWRQILTCPDTGEFLHRAAAAYRPGIVLAAAVRARDVTCTFPGCLRPAVACDLDHVEPFDPARPAAEQTCEHNLHPLCRHHHLIKTHGRWSVTRDEHTGVTQWTSPTRHQYTRPPAVLAGHPPRALPDLGPPQPDEIDDTPLFADDIDDDGWVPSPARRSEPRSVPFDEPDHGPGPLARAHARATGQTPTAPCVRAVHPDELCTGPPPY